MDYNLKDRTIVVAEDDQLNFILLQKILEQTSVNILWAKHGKEIIDFIKSGKKIDLILLDLNMPEMNGLETTTYLRSKECNIPIIVQSATSDMDEIDELLDAGCNDFVKKPISKHELLEKIAALIE